METPDTAKSGRSDLENSMNIAMFLIHIYATPPELLLHGAIGQRYYGFNTVGVVFAILFHAYLFRGHKVDLLISMILPYLMLLAAQRLLSWQATRKGIIQHSYVNGHSILRRQNSRIDEITFKAWIEPLLVLLVGLVFMPLNVPLASFILTCGIALRIKVGMSARLLRIRLLDMQDSMVEQQHFGRRFRQMTNPPNTRD